MTVKEFLLSHIKQALNTFKRIKLAERKTKARRFQNTLLVCMDKVIKEALIGCVFHKETKQILGVGGEEKALQGVSCDTEVC